MNKSTLYAKIFRIKNKITGKGLKRILIFFSYLKSSFEIKIVAHSINITIKPNKGGYW